MNPRMATGLAVVLVLIIFGGRFIKVIPPGHVGVAVLFGSVQDTPYPEGFHIVNPLLSWEDFDDLEPMPQVICVTGSNGKSTTTALIHHILKEAVRRMLPKNKLGRRMLQNLKLVCGAEHEHQAQQPQPFPEYLIPKGTK